MKGWLATLALLLLSTQAFAYCDGGYPNISVHDELHDAEFVVTGTVATRKILVNPEKDPEGYEAEIFLVKVSAVLFGNPPKYVTQQYLSLYNYNASSRFAMEEGKAYVLFVSASADGYWINSCGNSGELDESNRVIESIKSEVGSPHA